MYPAHVSHSELQTTNMVAKKVEAYKMLPQDKTQHKIHVGVAMIAKNENRHTEREKRAVTDRQRDWERKK